jgi:signal transduction histidine kinase
MNQIVDRILSLLSTPQGYLIIILVLVLFSFGAYQACVYTSGRQVSMEGKRMRQGLVTLLIAQLLLFFAAWLAWLGIIEEHAFLPVLDRTVALFSLVVLIWLWAFPKRNPAVDGIVLIIEAIILIAGVVSLVWWINQAAGQNFNTSMLGGYAYYAGIVFLVAGILVLFWQRPNAWGLGVSMLVILLGGYLAQYLVQQPAGDYAWLVRVGEMVAFIILLELPKRLPAGAKESQLPEEGKATASSSYPLNDKLIQSIVNLYSEKSPQQFYLKLSRLVAQVMGAEISLLVIPPKTGAQLIIPVGFNSPNDRAIDGFTVDGNKIPMLLEAVKNRASICIDGSKPDSEVKIILHELGLNQTGHIQLVPFMAKEDKSNEVSILVLSKPAQPIWSEADTIQLTEIANELATMFPHPGESNISGNANPEELAILEKIRVELENQRQEYVQLKIKYDDLALKEAGVAIGVGAAATLIGDPKTLDETVRQLEDRNRELELLVARGRPSIEEVEQLREELREALTDLARIPSTLSKSDQQMLELQLATMKRLDDVGQTELVSSISQELRQPLSAIIGYTDLLLGETVGLLGAVQKKFLERVKASSERLGILMEELVQVMAIDSGKMDQTLSKVDLESVIDEAIGNIIAQISEKNITMRVDLPEKLPDIRANKEALQQILANLLENACIVTPEDGEIRLFSRIEKKSNEPTLLLCSVTDQGGGIANADIPRIFSRRYKIENPLIQGIGDTGVGLSIVKSLVELNKGRVWLDSEEGIGSTFSVLIPIVEDQSGGETPSVN